MIKTKSAAAAVSASGELSLLLRIIDEGFERKAWHGPNLKGSIRGLSADQAAWRPAPPRHSIAENVVHWPSGSAPLPPAQRRTARSFLVERKNRFCRS